MTYLELLGRMAAIQQEIQEIAKEPGYVGISHLDVQVTMEMFQALFPDWRTHLYTETEGARHYIGTIDGVDVVACELLEA